MIAAIKLLIFKFWDCDMKNLFAVLIAITALTGCATNQTPTQRLEAGHRKTFDDTLSVTKECNEKLLKTDAGVIVGNQIVVLSPTLINKYDLMTSKAKLTSTQISALKTFLSEVSQCRQIHISGFSSIDAELANALILYYSKLDAIYLALLNDKFTIGDANVAKEKAWQEYQAADNVARVRYKESIQAMYNDEYGQRQRAAAVLLPLMMQQNAINAQNQQNLYNQQMQNIRSSTPAYTPPVQTTCQAVGNQIICNSR